MMFGNCPFILERGSESKCLSRGHMAGRSSRREGPGMRHQGSRSGELGGACGLQGQRLQPLKPRRAGDPCPRQGLPGGFSGCSGLNCVAWKPRFRTGQTRPATSLANENAESLFRSIKNFEIMTAEHSTRPSGQRSPWGNTAGSVCL